MKSDEFICRIKNIYGDLYDYSYVNYINNLVKVKLVCEKHGEFWKTPISLLYKKSGCNVCNNRITNTTEFIQKAKEIHGNKYDYSKVNYKSSKTPVIIGCNVHGFYSHQPNKHLIGRICPECSMDIKKKKRSLTVDKVKHQFIKIHGNRYDYSLFKNYENNHKEIKIICPKHGEFTQLPVNHKQGQGCPKCKFEKQTSSTLEFIKKAKEIHKDNYDYSIVNYVNSQTKVKIICPLHGSFMQRPNNHLVGQGCPKCVVYFSRFHEKIKNILHKQVEEHNRKIIYPFELDLYLYNNNLAIEINGIYWHSELQCKDKNYHLNKTRLCEEKGIQLLHITDYEIDNKFPIVKSELNSILDINKRKLDSKKCEVREISTETKSKFLNKYHLKGNDRASVNLGLFYNNKLISVMTFCKRKNDYKLSRYCGNFSFNVEGGMKNLLSYFESNYKPNKIITYVDKRWSNGEIYFKLGFKHLGDISPSYYYFKPNYLKDKLYDRYNFRKIILKNKLDKFDPNKTEWENMKENGWNRIWDCGNMIFEKGIL